MSFRALTRRTFIKAAGVTAAGVVLTGVGLGVAAIRTPAFDYPEIVLEGETPMKKRILVAYATRAGSTAEIAQAIAETLTARGYAVDVRPVKEKLSLDGYAAVVLGSAVRMGAWLPEAVNFVKANQAALCALPVALFTVHMLNTGDDEASQTARAAYVNSVLPLLNGAETVYFEGKMDFSRLSFLDRFIAKMVGAVEKDNRDWERIHAWANTVWS
ncbi:MAG: flavodoxin domain-containing protein [Caldilinea sp.]|nr:flavodoxin domain-containing protein [Caldilinea sp.]MDW8440307.1 flavodoxin domain-containing protein [Caldilineaceae bacterium]